MKKFWNDEIEPGYYDRVIRQGIEKNRGIQANWHNLTFKKLETYIGLNVKHLDYACGSGTFIGKYANTQSIGVDISTKQISYAKKHYSSRASFLDLENFSFKDYENFFDVVSILGLFEFINDEDILEVIGKLKTTLKKNGKILITTPNFNSSISTLSKLSSFIGGIDYREQHINKFNEKKARALLEGTDFTNVKIIKILNFGVLFSIINLSLGENVEKYIERMFNTKIGYLLFIELSN